ncbi:MAG: protein phosphatase 2C domain-containing protein [Cyanobacteria bacterium J06638_28]
MPNASRYLWAQGSVSVPPAKGILLAGRYQVVQFPLLIDTEPEVPPTPLEAVPSLAAVYLSLSSFAISVPRPFTQIWLPETDQPLLLLEEIPVRVLGQGNAEQPKLMATLLDAWPTASALHQVTWLWQLAKLWEPCCEQQVAASLLDWQAVRVDGEDIRLLTLQPTSEVPSLVDLGKCWQTLVSATQPGLQAYLTHLVQRLTVGDIAPTELVDFLTQALETIVASQSASLQLATCSDQGPVRRRNEDACYPPSGAVLNVAVSNQQVPPFVVVCDGVGGHQGGDVASQLAIDEVSQYLQTAATNSNLPDAAMVTAIKQAIFAANQAIVERNDAAQRQERARMGTTIVIAVIAGARLYIGHIGDSRVYRIRTHQCRQITLDDDIATREMRLGIRLYHDGLQEPGSGALVQALGMVNSRNLHPTVDMYPIAETSLFLICSDGLSDRGLVDQIGLRELQPMLMGERDIATTSQRLVELANTQNGHDNVTVALLHVIPDSSEKVISSVPPNVIEHPLPTSPVVSETQMPGVPNSSPQKTLRIPLSLPLILLGILVVSIVGAYYWSQQQSLSSNTLSSSSESQSGETLSPSAVPPDSTRASSLEQLSVGDYLQVEPATDLAADILLTKAPEPPPSDSRPADERLVSILPTDSVVQIIDRQPTQDNQFWVRLQVCTVTSSELSEDAAPPSTDAQNAPSSGDRIYPLALPGEQGWLLETSLPEVTKPLLDTTLAQQGSCMN